MKNIVLAALMSLLSTAASAAVIFVDNDQDLSALDGNCDLRDAINSANINISIDGCVSGESGVQDVVIVQVPGPIQLESTLPVFSSIYIGTTFGAEAVEIRGAPDQRIMRVIPNSVNDNNFAMVNFTLTGGATTDEIEGGAIYFSGMNAPLGMIEITNMQFINNQGHNGGALSFNETFAESLRIVDSTFIGNHANNIGGAISGFRVVQPGTGSSILMNRNLFENNSAGGTGGAVFMRNDSLDEFELNTNHFFNNVATDDVGALGIGGVVDTPTITVNQSLFLHNQAGGDAGALQVGFGAIVYVRNALFAFNEANRGGAVTSVFDDALLRLNSSTLVHNSAAVSGDNIYVFGSGRLLPSRNIIAYPQNGDNCAGSLNTNPPASIRDNITDDASCELLNTVANTLVADPMLSGTSDQEGSFPGFAPTVNSPAIDSTDICDDEDAIERDRPMDGDGNGSNICDIGAIEAMTQTDLIWQDAFGF